MKLTLEQISAVARGVVRVLEEDGLVRLCRFTREQEAFYEVTNEQHYRRTFGTAGVVLEFDTDSRSLSLDVRCSMGSSRHWFVHSIFADGKRVGELRGKYEQPGYADAAASFPLGEGTKRVQIRFPWSSCSRIRALELDDGASFVPVKKPGKVLIYGDSITQGYDAAVPENAYASCLAEYLDMDCINKAIGGEVFRPGLSEWGDDFQPDLITVAYGTNDWPRRPVAEIEENARQFLNNLRSHYPQTKIVLLAPVWRKISDEVRHGTTFDAIAAMLNSLAAEMDNAVCIDCFSFVPHDLALYSPDGVHPNDAGFAHYTQGLLAALKAQGIGRA